MKSILSRAVGPASALLISALLISACSSSTNSQTLNDAASSENIMNDNAAQTVSGVFTQTTEQDSAQLPSNPNSPAFGFTRVTFNITVPAGNELWVETWYDYHDSDECGDNFYTRLPCTTRVSDDTWTLTLDFPTDSYEDIRLTTYNRLDNDRLYLALYQRGFKTGTSTFQQLTITANQFDTTIYDKDRDGMSNIDELNVGTDPLMHNEPDYSSYELNLIDHPDYLVSQLNGAALESSFKFVSQLSHTLAQRRSIIWPNNDWYELIPARESENVCEGRTECEIMPGSYTVINHTTGERSSLQVPVLAPADIPHATVLADSTITLEDDEPSINNTIITLKRAQYSCENGGTLTRESGSGRPAGINTNFLGHPTATHRSYQFNQCRVTIRNKLIPDVAYLLNGTVLSDVREYGGRGCYGSDSPDCKFRFSYDGFSMIADNGSERHLHGAAVEAFNHDRYTRSASVDNYENRRPDGLPSTSITNAEYYYYSDWPRFELSAQGIVRNERTANQNVTITTEQAITRELEFNNDEYAKNYIVATTVRGKITLLAETGSTLDVQLNPLYDPTYNSFKRYDFDHTPAIGERRKYVDMEFISK